MLTRLLLAATLLASATNCTRYRVETRTVPVPADPCVLPPDPVPMGMIEVYDLDGDGNGTDLGMSEDSAKILLVFIGQLKDAWELAKKCPNVIQETNEAPVRVPPPLAKTSGQSRA